VLTLTTGTIFVMWLGEQITERGVGNGISLLIFAGYRDRSAERRQTSRRAVSAGGDTMATIGVFAMLVAMVLIIAFIVFVESARRKIPVSYAKRHVGTAACRWSADHDAAEDQHGRRDPGHLRFFLYCRCRRVCSRRFHLK
jgi:preprotein translocase subunit SecY